jgi:hypothetical protein
VTVARQLERLLAMAFKLVEAAQTISVVGDTSWLFGRPFHRHHTVAHKSESFPAQHGAAREDVQME